jgi:hypothetical protein
MSYIGNEPIVSATRTVTEVTATAGQTVFNANGGYTVGYLDVFLNGAQLQTVDFTATNGSSITLTESAQVGDVIRLVAWGTFNVAAVFPSGTKMLFVQTSAPTGWTKDTSHDNKALRVVSGTASSGGSVAFTTAFASQAVSGTVGTSGATTLSTAQMPSHAHGGGASGSFLVPVGSFYALPAASNTGSQGGGGSHTHSGGTFTGTAIDLAVQYVDVIIATKD